MTVSEHRNVTLKDLGNCEYEGWLQQRCRKGSGQWNRGWFVIKGTTFYGFRHKEVGIFSVKFYVTLEIFYIFRVSTLYYSRTLGYDSAHQNKKQYSNGHLSRNTFFLQ